MIRKLLIAVLLLALISLGVRMFGPSQAHVSAAVCTNWATGLPTPCSGAAGSTGPGYQATSSTSLTIGSGSTTFTTQSGLAYAGGALSFAAICSSAAPTACFYGTVTSYSGTTLVVNVTGVSGSGTHSDWLITVSGAIGAQGATGAAGTGYQATSSTSLTIGSGSTTFTTQSGLAYVSGSLSYAAICSSAAPTACFYGTVTSYSGTTLVVNVSSTNGTGTHSDWLISVSGATGATGAAGAAFEITQSFCSAGTCASDTTTNVKPVVGITGTVAFYDCYVVYGGTGGVIPSTTINIYLYKNTTTFSGTPLLPSNGTALLNTSPWTFSTATIGVPLHYGGTFLSTISAGDQVGIYFTGTTGQGMTVTCDAH